MSTPSPTGPVSGSEAESRRLARLHLLAVMDSGPEPIFDSLARAASTICGTPISLVSLLDDKRQWFKANVGLDGVQETARDIAFCAHAIESGALLEVGDALLDARFKTNPLVTGEPGIRFYAGAPIVMPGGERLGTLCVIDRQPRQLSPEQQHALSDLATAVAQALLLRERFHYFEVAGHEDRFKVIAETSPLGIFHADLQGNCTYTNPRWREIYGIPLNRSLGAAWREMVHPDDREMLFAGLKKSAQLGGSMRMEYRLRRSNGEVIHVRAQARSVTWGDPPQRGFVGAVEDISSYKLVEEELRASNRFLDRAERIAGVGGWEVGLRNRSIKWTDQCKHIYELPADFQPDFATHLAHFGPESQAIIEKTAQEAMRTGEPWDLELPMVTAKGRRVWTRSVGLAEFEGGQPVRLVGALQDITAKKAVEEELRRANSLLQGVLDNLPCGMSVFDGDLHMVAHNAQFRSLLDLPDSLFDVPVVTFESIIRHNASRGEYGDGPLESLVNAIVARARDPAPHHFQRTRPNGITLDIRGSPMPGGGFVTTYVDVSAAKDAEKALRLSEERQHRAFVASGVVLWDLDIETGQVYLSENWTDLVGGGGGTTATTLQALVALVPPEDQLAIRDAFVPVLKGSAETYAVEHRVRKADGTTTWVLSVGRVTRRDANGRALRASGTNQDVNARKRAEIEQQNAAAITSATLDATEDGILVVNDQREIVLFNQRFLDMWRFPPDIVGGDNRQLTRFAITQVKDPRAFLAKLDELYKDAVTESFDVLEFRDGRAFERYSKPHRLGMEAFGRVWSFRDVTARRTAEAELKLAKDAADAANRAKTDFLANMSHEIRTPLNGVIGLTRFLLEENLSASQRQHAELIDGSAQSLLILINDFLDFSKIEAGELTVEKVAFDLHGLLEEVSSPHALRAAEKGLNFGLDIEASVPAWVNSDPTRIRQIVNNLLGNALKFTAKGQVALAVSTSPADAGGLLLRIAVTDTGIGISKETQEKLFTRFSQADSSTSRQYGGTGLGLAIVRQLSELLGGRVELQSVPQEGSTFLVYLPVTAAEARARETVTPSVVTRTSSARILLVEDNPTNQVVALGVLRRLGFAEVTVASNGREAVEMALSRPFGAILMDCHMPEVDGYKATQLLRAGGCSVPIIAMTANAMKGDREKCLAAGMNDYLTKPIEKQALATALDAWLSRSPADSAEDEDPVADSDAVSSGQTAPVVYDQVGVAQRFKGDDGLLPLVMASFFEHTPPLISKLEKAVRQGNFQEVHLYAHTVGGSAATVGAQALRATTMALEKHGLDNNAGPLGKLFAQLEKDFHEFQITVGGGNG
jgi:PAS domain S-box-containing protein